MNIFGKHLVLSRGLGLVLGPRFSAGICAGGHGDRSRTLRTPRLVIAQKLLGCATVGALCLMLAGCGGAEAKAAKCSSLTLVSSGNEPELEWYSGILKSYLVTYLFDLGEMKPGAACTLETRFEGDLDRAKGYVHRSRVVQAGQVIWSYEHTAGEPGTFSSSFHEAFDMVAGMDKAGIIAVPNRELLEPGDPKEIVDKLCARETVEPLARGPQHDIDTVLILATRYRIDEDPCFLFCQAFVAEWRGKALQVKASIHRKYLLAIFDGRKRGAVRVQNNWAYTSPAITTPGYYQRLISGDPKDFKPISTPINNIFTKREDAYRYAGGVVSESRLIQSDGKNERLIGLSIRFTTRPDHRLPYALQEALQVVKFCSKGIPTLNLQSPGTLLARALNDGDKK